MTDDTPLDLAHDAMEAGGDAERLRFYERVADAELFVMLDREDKDMIVPRIFPIEGGDVVLAFDRVERLAEFSGKVTSYAALPGRAVAAMLAGQAVGLGLNLGVARSSLLLPPEAVDWLAGMTAQAPVDAMGRPTEFRPPTGVPQAQLTGLDTKLALTGSLARSAYLARVVYDDGRNGHLLAFVDAAKEAEDALSRAVAEALIFSGVDAAEIDVAFLASSDPICARMARVGLRFDLPEPAAQAAAPRAPGMDPDQPPKLR